MRYIPTLKSLIRMIFLQWKRNWKVLALLIHLADCQTGSSIGLRKKLFNPAVLSSGLELFILRYTLGFGPMPERGGQITFLP
jgi:hypothetical protein